MPEHAGGVSDLRVREIAEAAAESAAEKTVAKVLRTLRIRLDDESSVDEFIDNQRFIKRMRERGGKIAEGGRSLGFDVLKHLLLMLLMGAIGLLGAGLGTRFGTPSSPASPPGIASLSGGKS